MSDINRFRVWDNELKEYDGLDFFINRNGDLCYEYSHYDDEGYLSNEIRVDGSLRYTIERCTALKDYNNRLIFVGDIIEIDSERFNILEFDGCFGFFTKFGFIELCRVEKTTMKIVSTIHEVQK